MVDDRPSCGICLQHCRIPVKMTCFACYDRTKMHCHSIQRFCLTCAHNFLEMDRVPMGNVVAKTCMYCRTDMVSGKKRSAHHPYEIDFFSMSKDEHAYACVQPDCPFRGTHVELFHHLEGCGYAMLRCDGCFENVRRDGTEDHKSVCSGHTQCSLCNEYVLLTTLPRHQLRVHKMKRCSYCSDSVPLDTYDDHFLHECEALPVHCTYCGLVYVKDDELDHLCAHLKEYQEEDMRHLQEFHRLKGRIEDVRGHILRLST